MSPGNAKVIGALGYGIVRALLATVRIRVEDHAGMMRRPALRPVLWAFWHNRLFIIPYLFDRVIGQRPGAAMTSASKDGEVLAALLGRFGIQSVRGSSSRRGAIAWRELRRAMQNGADGAITPDGPRGPRYQLKPGILVLSQKSGIPILPVQVRYSSCFRLKSWDGFMIPRPFCRIDVTFEPLLELPESATEEEVEEARARLEALLCRDEI